MNTQGLKLATGLIGALVATSFIAICLITGIPSALPPENAQAQFSVALALNALLILSPFLYASFRVPAGPEAPVPLTLVAILLLPVGASLLLTILLYVGLGFQVFLIVHILLVAMLSLAWLGLLGMGSTAQDMGQRQALSINRRQSIVAALSEVQANIATMPSQYGPAKSVLAEFMEELRLLTPMQTDRNPALMSKLWVVVNDLRLAADKQEDAMSWQAALAAAKAATEALKRA